jgi:predicted ATP-grasp superfamily ATP-dependent carboligase
MKPRVLVTDGDQRASLAVVRSLGRAGYQISVAAARTPSLAGASRWAASERRVPDPLREPAAFVDAVAAMAYAESAELLLPMTDASLLALLGARERFPGISLPFPGLDVFRRVADKQVVLATARTAGIAVPEQRVISTQAEASKLASAALSYPLVLKPARSVSGSDAVRQKFGVRHIEGPEELRAAMRDLPRQAFPVLLQQRIVGPGVGIFLLVWNGRTRAVFAHRRLREKPPSGGVSVYRESIPADPALVERSRALLDALGFEGVAMVEYKVEAASGTPYLMEINGRFWGSLQLAVDAGVDFPRLLAESALGADTGPVPAYTVGVRSRWWWGDIDQLLARLIHPRARLALAPDEPGRLRALRDFLNLWGRGDRSEILRRDDPRPFLRESLDWFRRR